MKIESKDKHNGTLSSPDNATDRRELIQKLGKFAVYAAPFTVLASTAKAASASGPSASPHLK